MQMLKLNMHVATKWDNLGKWEENGSVGPLGALLCLAPVGSLNGPVGEPGGIRGGMWGVSSDSHSFPEAVGSLDTSHTMCWSNVYFQFCPYQRLQTSRSELTHYPKKKVIRARERRNIQYSRNTHLYFFPFTRSNLRTKTTHNLFTTQSQSVIWFVWICSKWSHLYL